MMSATVVAQRSVLNQDLLHAISNGDGRAIRRLVKLGADMNYHPGEDVIPLILNYTEIRDVRKLMEERVISNTAFGTPLLLAVLRQDVDIVECLIDLGAEVDYDQHSWFKEALRELALEGADEMIAALADYGDHIASTPRTALCATLDQAESSSRDKLLHIADPNSPLGWPLVAASSAGNEKAVRALLEKGASQSIVEPWSLELYDMEQDPIVKSHLFKLVNLDKRREFGWSAIGVAATRGFASIVEILLLNKSLSARACNEAFWVASQAGNEEIVMIFLTHGVDMNFDVGFAKGNPLTAAARNGRESIVTRLLEHGADPNFSIGGSRPPLEDAISFGFKGIAKMLLNAGADPNGQKEGHVTPLIKAVEKEEIELCQVLLGHGADINAASNYLGSPLTVAAATGNLEMFEMLRRRGARLDVKEEKLITTVSAACGGGFSGEGSIQIVQALLDAGMDVNQPSAKGTPLQIAASRGKESIVRFLVDKGADVNIRSTTYNKNTPLESAVEGGNVMIVKFLLEKGAKITDAVTLLQLGAAFADENMVKFLMDTNPQLAQMEHQFPEILDGAARSEKFKSIAIILERTKTNIATDYAMKKAVKGNQESLIRLLLTRGVTVGSALGWAIYYKQKGICRTLLNDFSGNEDKQLLNYVLQGSASNGWQDMVHDVLNRGADVNAVIGNEPDSDNMLISAVSSGHVPTIRLLLDRGADLSQPGALGKALQKAGGNNKVKRLLISRSKKPVGPQLSPVSNTSAAKPHIKFALPDVNQAGKRTTDGHEVPQPPLVPRYRVLMSGPLEDKKPNKKPKKLIEAELQVRLEIEAQAVAAYEQEENALGSVGADKETSIAVENIPQNAANQIRAPSAGDNEGYQPYDSNDFDYADANDAPLKATPATPDKQVPVAIQAPVDGLEKPVAISSTVSTCNLTLAVFRADSKGTVQRRLRICRPDCLDRAVADIDTDEKLFRAMRKTYNHELSSLFRRLFSFKSLKQITVLSYTDTTRPTPVPYDDFTLQEIMYLFRDPSHLSSPSTLPSSTHSIANSEHEQPWIDWVFRLKTSDNGRKHILRFEEAWDGTKIAIAGSLPFVASCLIAVGWSAKGGDVQTVFAVASFVLGAGTALLALVGILSSVGS